MCFPVVSVCGSECLVLCLCLYCVCCFCTVICVSTVFVLALLSDIPRGSQRFCVFMLPLSTSSVFSWYYSIPLFFFINKEKDKYRVETSK